MIFWIQGTLTIKLQNIVLYQYVFKNSLKLLKNGPSNDFSSQLHLMSVMACPITFNANVPLTACSQKKIIKKIHITGPLWGDERWLPSYTTCNAERCSMPWYHTGNCIRITRLLWLSRREFVPSLSFLQLHQWINLILRIHSFWSKVLKNMKAVVSSVIKTIMLRQLF